jgi:hypothetical protein
VFITKKDARGQPRCRRHSAESCPGRPARRLADRDLAEQLRVVRDGREVERAREADRPQRRAVLCVGLDPDRLAAREAVGLVRTVAGALGGGVERVAGVDVNVAEEGAALRVVYGASRALRLRRGCAREPRQRQRDGRHAPLPHPSSPR